MSLAATGAPEQRPALDPALRFVLTAGAWLLGLLALLRAPWIRQSLLDPFARLQQQVTAQMLGAPTTGVIIDASCSGGDAMALCLGVLIAYPASWRQRLRGIALGFLLILTLNLLRIATLSALAGDPALFDLLHLYVWRGILIVAVATYVFAWMQWVGRGRDHRGDGESEPRRLLRFALIASAFTTLYFAVSPMLSSSSMVDGAAQAVARSGAATLAAMGIPATASGVLLSTPRGSFLVTPECVVTPLIPLYLAVLFAAPLSPLRRAAALLVAPVLFFALGVMRLLVLALPAFVVPSHALAIHAFSQFVVALLVIVVTAFALAGGRRGLHADADADLRQRGRRAALALGAFVAAGILAGPLWGRAVNGMVASLQRALLDGVHVIADPQAALATLPAFQFALAVGMCVALGGLREPPSRPPERDGRARASGPARRAGAAVAGLAAFQVAFLVVVAEASAHLGLSLHVSLIRAIALLAPVLLMWALVGGLRASARSSTDVAALEQPG